MLSFLRKYQRFFFIIITAVLVLSFSFFGTQSTMFSQNKVEDREIGKAFDGSSMSRLEMDKMIRFIGTDRLDGKAANFFNDGVIRNDFFASGLGYALGKTHFHAIKAPLTEKLAKQKRFKAYVHPTASFISAENIWAQVSPGLKGSLQEVIAYEGEVDETFLEKQIDLYLKESVFPAHMLRQFLSYQQNQFAQVPADPYIERGELSLFRYHQAEDWFGPQFIEAIAQFIHNVALYAESNGYKVSYAEARTGLIQIGYETIKAQLKKDQITPEELGTYFKNQLAYLHLDEKSAVEVWQKVMLFRKYFDDYSHYTFVDPVSYEGFQNFASEEVSVDLYTLPHELVLRDFEDLMKFQFYLDQISKEQGLLFPKKHLSLSDIEKNCGSLVVQEFDLNMAKVRLDEVALNIGLMQMWEWQEKPGNFAILKKEFPELATQSLDALNETIRNKVDIFSREQIIKQNPERIHEALEARPLAEQKLVCAMSGEIESLPGISDQKAFIKLLNQAPINGAFFEPLTCYSQDQTHFYRITIKMRNDTKNVLTFQEANNQGILKRELNAFLKNQYSTIRSNEPTLFRVESGGWKPFHEVKEEVGKIVYRPLIKKLEKVAQKEGITLQKGDFNAYAQYRMLPIMGEMLERLKKDPESLESSEGLAKQWEIKKQEADVARGQNRVLDNAAFSQKIGTYSSIYLNHENALSFYFLKEKKETEASLFPHMEQGQKLLSRQAKLQLMEELIEKLTCGIHLEEETD